MTTVLLEGVVGSQAQGLATSESDVDTAGVFLFDSRDFWGLYPPGDRDSTTVTTNPDSHRHELGKFVRLALKSTPSVLELLYLDKYETLTTAGALLVSERHMFPTQSGVRGSYLGYATAQFEKLKQQPDKKRRDKYTRHMSRLLDQGVHLYQNGFIVINVSNRQEHYQQLAEQATQGDFSQLEAQLVDAEQKFRGPSPLRVYALTEYWGNRLVQIRRNYYEKGIY